MNSFLEKSKNVGKLGYGHEKGVFKFCPHCGSADLKITGNTGFVIAGALAMYHCNHCQCEVLPFEGDKKFVYDYLHKLRAIKAMDKKAKPAAKKKQKKKKQRGAKNAKKKK